MKTAFIYTPEFLKFNPPKDHPWSNNRAQVTFELCKKLDLIHRPWIDILEPPVLDEDALYLFHSRTYIDLLKEANTGQFKEEWLRYGVGTTECPVYPGVYDYHRMAAGGTVLCADLLMKSEADRAFNVSGGFHHAGKDFAAGFCYINDMVIAIKLLLKSFDRVMYLDIDAHHGDQVQKAFYSSNRVLTVSFHQDTKTLFPFEGGGEKEIGRGKGKGYCINVPMAPGTGDEEFLWAFEEIFIPSATSFKPDVTVAVIGTDGLAPDPLANLEFTNRVYSTSVDLVCQYSQKILATGGGGYSLEHSCQAWALAWATMNNLGCNEEDMVSFGGVFWGDGVCSLQGNPVFVPEKTRKKASEQLKRVVKMVKKQILPLIRS